MRFRTTRLAPAFALGLAALSLPAARPLWADFFSTVPPCRLLDTRLTNQPLVDNSLRSYTVANTCGIPGNATAVSFNFTLTGVTAPLSLAAFPADVAPTGTAVLWANPSHRTTVAGAAVIAVSRDGLAKVTVAPSFASAGRADLIVDVNGFFSVLAPALVFADQSIQAQGMSAGGSIVWFGIAQSVEEYAVTLSQYQGVTVADAQGRSTLNVAPAVPRHSLWVAVDLTTSLDVLAAPSSFAVRRFALSPVAVIPGGGTGGGGTLIRDASDTIAVLLVRPGQGAWSKSVSRGGPDDQAPPGAPYLAVAVSHLQPIQAGGPAAPASLLSGDLLVVAHPRVLEIGVLVMGSGP